MSVSLFFSSPSWFTGMIFLFFMFRIGYTQNKLIIGVSVFFALLISLLCIRYRVQEVIFPNQRELAGYLKLSPDKMVVNGDQLTAEGLFYYRQKKQKVTLVYPIQSQNEQNFWKNNRSYLELSLKGIFSEPLGQTNLHGFDYQGYLKQKGILQILSINRIESVLRVKPRFYRLDQQLVLLRVKLLRYCDVNFPPQTSLYLKSLILGENAAINQEQRELFSQLGILSFFSVSGMHVIFFLSFVRYLCLRIGITQETTVILTFFFSVFYVGITGVTISVIRVVLQQNVRNLDRQLGGCLSSLDCWGISVLLHLLVNPFMLATFGGQFSYYLSFSRLMIQPIVQPLKKVISKNYLSSVLMSVAALPLLIFYFHECSLLASSFTFLLMPLFRYLLLPSLSVLFFLSFFIQCSFLVDFVEGYLRCQQIVFQWFSQWQLTFVTGAFPMWLLLAITCLLISLFFLLQIKSKKFFLVSILLCLLLSSKYLSPKGMIAFIDVGQGDSIFIQAPFQGEAILIDTGGRLTFSKDAWAMKEQVKAAANYTVIPFLKSMGVQRLDSVFITHGHVDHYGDLLAIHEKIPIHRLYYPAGTENKSGFRKFLEKLKASGTNCVPVLAPQRLGEKIPLHMLAPTSRGNGENNDSMVLYTRIQNSGFLLTGDLEQQGEQALLNYFPKLEIDILKVGHHGSKTATDPMFIKQITPTIGIISCGRKNRFNHPHQETVSTLQKNNVAIYRTDEQGMIYFEWTPLSTLSKPHMVKKEH